MTLAWVSTGFPSIFAKPSKRVLYRKNLRSAAPLGGRKLRTAAVCCWYMDKMMRTATSRTPGALCSRAALQNWQKMGKMVDYKKFAEQFNWIPVIKAMLVNSNMKKTKRFAIGDIQYFSSFFSRYLISSFVSFLILISMKLIKNRYITLHRYINTLYVPYDVISYFVCSLSPLKPRFWHDTTITFVLQFQS